MFKIALAGGGTLGSVSPLLAIQEAIPEAEYIFVGTRHGIEHQLVRRAGIPHLTIPSVKLRRYSSIRNIVDVIKFPLSIIAAFKILVDTKPSLIITAGSFVSVPVSIAARTLGIPVILHHQDIEIGLANKIVRHLATIITVTFPHQQQEFPGNKTVVTGNPIRSHIRHQPSLERNEILILGGSQGAATMNEELNKIIPDLSKRYSIVHVLGKNNFHQKLNLEKNYIALDFLEREISTYLSRAAIVITRGGLSTLTELAACKRPTILIPLPNSHQEKNANFFESRESALVIPQKNITTVPNSIDSLIANPQRRNQLGANLHSLFPSQASKNYRNLINTRFKIPHERIAHCVGIGGIGISALAQYLATQGYRITGSDLATNEVTKRMVQRGIEITHFHSPDNIPEATSLVIYSTAVLKNNVELVEARKRKIPIFSYKEYLGLISNRYRTVAISGTHGKTTTTALTGFVLQETNHDPTVIVGAFIPQFNHQNFRMGKSDTLVVEADEYRSDMLYISPTAILLTNIDLDHPDFYQDIHEVQKAFQQFVMKLAPNGVLIKNSDDPYTAPLKTTNTITVGLKEGADYRARLDKTLNGRQYFSIFHHGNLLVSSSLQLPGSFNVINALTAFAYAHHTGIDPRAAANAIASFRGSWRRFEKVGTLQDAPVYSDYAHHPTAIVKTIEGIRSFYPERKLLVAYQPHSYARTYALQNDFANAFVDVDTIILTEIYDVAGRDVEKKITGSELFEKINHPDKYFAPSYEDILKKLREFVAPGMIIVIMGAGDIDAVARTIVSPLHDTH